MAEVTEKLVDPVALSGGNRGGDVVEGSGWEVGVEAEFSGLIYRRVERDENPETPDQAVFCGKAK